MERANDGSSEAQSEMNIMELKFFLESQISLPSPFSAGDISKNSFLYRGIFFFK